MITWIWNGQVLEFEKRELVNEVQVDRFPIVEIRRLVLSLSHLNPVQSPIINRARQDLASQFPEVALVLAVRSGKKVPLLWGWLCSQRQSVKYDLMLDGSIGLGITDERKPARCADLWYSAGRDGARISTFERYSNRLGGYGVNWE